MAADDDATAEILLQFDAAIAGRNVDELHQLAAKLLGTGGLAPRLPSRPQRPDLRRPPLPELRCLRVRVDLKHARPPIWRRLDLRSDLTLDMVHRVLQAAFEWNNSHLWRFSLGGDPFARDSQFFLCEWDVEDGDIADEGGVPAESVRLDETIQNPGDVLSYVYDYGDNWELQIKLEAVLDGEDEMPTAHAIDGRRAAPPDDCGGLTTAEELAEVLEDPAHFDLAEINDALRDPASLLRRAGFADRLVDLVDRLRFSPVDEDLSDAAFALVSDDRPVPDESAMRAALEPFTWFLGLVGTNGLVLTAAGYLKPADVVATVSHLPTMARWIGKANRENDAYPVLLFREALQKLGLIRKAKGMLSLTRAGRDGGETWQELWNHMADRLVPTKPEFDRDATLLLLLFAAAATDGDLPLDTIADALTHLGWRVDAGRPVPPAALYNLTALTIFQNLSEPETGPRFRWRLSPAARELARAALKSR